MPITAAQHSTSIGLLPYNSKVRKRTCVPVHRLSLLNTTVSQLAKSVNAVLTMAYRDIYADGPNDDVGQLQLLTSPLAATEEVLNLFHGGLVPIEIAMPAVMHSIGSTKEDIDKSLESAKKLQKEKQDCERCERLYLMREHELNIKQREAGITKSNSKDVKTVEDNTSASLNTTAVSDD